MFWGIPLLTVLTHGLLLPLHRFPHRGVDPAQALGMGAPIHIEKTMGWPPLCVNRNGEPCALCSGQCKVSVSDTCKLYDTRAAPRRDRSAALGPRNLGAIAHTHAAARSTKDTRHTVHTRTLQIPTIYSVAAHRISPDARLSAASWSDAARRANGS